MLVNLCMRIHVKHRANSKCTVLTIRVQDPKCITGSQSLG